MEGGNRVMALSGRNVMTVRGYGRRRIPIGVDASPIWRSYSGGELWIGSYPTDREGPSWAGFDTLVLAAKELQGPDGYFQGVSVIKCPLSDAEPMKDGELSISISCAHDVARMVAQGRKVLVTCAMGRNRSALICGLVLQMITTMSGPAAVSRIKSSRPTSLGNRSFEQAILGYRLLYSK
jgi:hypothetical protein